MRTPAKTRPAPLPVRRRSRRTPLGRAAAAIDRVGMLTAGYVLGALSVSALIALSSYMHI